MLRLITGRPGTIQVKIYDEDGVAADPASVSVVVRDGSGTQVATGSATESITTGLWTYTVGNSVTDDLDEYEATWTYTLDAATHTQTTKFEVCGGHTFEIAELRAADSTLADTTDYPADKIKQARVDAEQRFERGAKVAFVHRARRVELISDGRPRLVLPDCEVAEIIAIEVDGEAKDETDADLYVHGPEGVIEHPTWWSAGSIVSLYYIHGIENTPEPVSRAIKTLAIEYLVPSALPARATSQSTDRGEFRINLAGKDGTTGIPEVDSVMMEFGRRRPAIG